MKKITFISRQGNKYVLMPQGKEGRSNKWTAYIFQNNTLLQTYHFNEIRGKPVYKRITKGFYSPIPKHLMSDLDREIELLFLVRDRLDVGFINDLVEVKEIHDEILINVPKLGIDTPF